MKPTAAKSTSKFLVEGNETIFYALIATLQPAEYQVVKDYQLLDGTGIPFALHAFELAIFFLRMPISPGEPWVSFSVCGKLWYLGISFLTVT